MVSWMVSWWGWRRVIARIVVMVIVWIVVATPVPIVVEGVVAYRPVPIVP